MIITQYGAVIFICLYMRGFCKNIEIYDMKYILMGYVSSFHFILSLKEDAFNENFISQKLSSLRTFVAYLIFTINDQSIHVPAFIGLLE